MRRLVRKRFARHHPGPFDCVVGGLRMRLYPAENHCDRTIVGRSRLPEAPERALITPLLAPDMVFVDIGANVGVYCLFVARHAGPDARIIALEPHPRTFAKLDYNCIASGFDGIIRINAAAGSDVLQATLYADGGGNIGNASLLAAVGGGKEAVSVALRPLADILRDQAVDRVDLMKVDVEGFEDQALLPFLQTAPPWLWPRHVLVETVHRSLWGCDVIDTLKSSGYGVVAKTAENLLLRRKMAR